MSTSNIYISPSTSLVLIKNINLQTTVYLSTLNVPDFQIKVRDTTGSPLLATNPIHISTIGGANFGDKSYYYAINKPYGFVNLALRNSTIWQILHTSGQVPAQSAADIQTTSISTSYFALMSTNLKYVSTMQIENLLTPNSIDVTGPFVIGNLSTPGFILLKSSLNVYGNTLFQKNLFVSGGSLFKSSLTADVLLPLSSILLSYSSIGVGENLFVGQETTVLSTFQIKGPVFFDNLQVQRSTTLDTIQTNFLEIGKAVSSLKDFYTGSTLQIASSLVVYQNVSSLSGIFSTKQLNLEGPLQIGRTLSTLSSLQFFSSLELKSSLIIQSDFNSLSTATVANTVSTSFFVTNFLSSSTSFSTAGEFAVLQTLTTKGNLSSFEIFIPTLFSTGRNFLTMSYVSTYGQAKLSSLEGFSNANLSTLAILSSMGVYQDLNVRGDVNVDSLYVNGMLKVGSNLFVREFAQFNQNVGVRSNIYVKGNMTVDGVAYIPSFDVPSYEVSTLEILTSSPAIGLRASSLFLALSTNVNSLESQLVYAENSGDVNLSVEPQSIGASTFAAKRIYAERFSENYISTSFLYTDSLINKNTSLNSECYPAFEILQSSLFVRGLSTNIVVSDRITGGTFYANFIGSAELLNNIPLAFSNISANTMTASTVSTSLISSHFTELANPKIDDLVTIEKALYFATPFALLSTSIKIDSNLFFGDFGQSNTPFLQSVDLSTLTINNTLYFDSGAKKLGVMTSTPQYQLDISGSLYYSGFLYYTNQENMLDFSTQKESISFSTILFSSIYIRDSLQIPQNTSWPLENAITLSYVPPETTPGPRIPLVLAESYFPILPNTDALLAATSYFSTGIFTNSNYSTLDINYHLICYNQTKNIGINTITSIDDGLGGISSNFPTPLQPTYSLVVQGDFQGTELRTSTMYIACKLTASTIEMPTFGINPITVSTFHTLSTSYLRNLTDSLLTLDSFVEFYKASTNVGYFSIKRPQTGTFANAALSIYRDAYISSVVSESVHATNFFVGTQTI